MAWTEEAKKEVIEMYLAANPTAENSTEIVKEIADKFEQSVNGVRMILIQSGDYVKKDPNAKPTGKTTSKTADGGDKPKRVSKEDQIAALRALIEDRGHTPDDEVLGKLTGKAAQYLVSVFS